MHRDVLHNLQAARFVAAMGVLIHHANGIFLHHHSLDPPPFLGIRWNCGVDIFFVISGFIMAWLTSGRFGDRSAPKDFLLRRIIRIAPPYWLFTTLLIVTDLTMAPYVLNATLKTPQIVTSYLFIPWPRGDGRLNPLLSQGWTLNYEAFFYTAFAAALFFKRGLLWLTLAFLLLVALHPLVPREAFPVGFWSQPIILEFLFGIGLAQLYRRRVRLPWPAALLCVAAGVLVAACPLGIDPAMLFSRLAVNGVPALLIGGGLILAAEPRQAGAAARLVKLGGDSSYALYLSHTFTINAVELGLRRVGLFRPWIGFALGIACAVAVSILFYKLIERPLTEALQRVFGTRPIRGAADVAP